MQTETKTRPPTYKITIDGQEHDVDDPVITGRQLLKLIKKDPRNHVIYQLLPDHEMEQLRPDETTDLRERGVEEFLTFKTDRLFRFELNGHGLEWGAPRINGRTLKKLADVDPEEYVVWQEIEGRPDRLIEDREMVDLSAEGVEVFKTRKTLITVYYNQKPEEIEKGTYTTEQLRDIFKVEAGYVFEIIIDGEFIELKPGQPIKVKKGMQFLSHAPRGESS
jgi:hypothetical protein